MHWSDYPNIFTHISTRYFMVAGIAFLLFYVLFRKFISYQKIQSRFPQVKDYAREIGYSLFTMCLFALVPVIFIKNPAVAVHTTLYKNISDHGWVYFFLAFPIMAIMHDTYFYWAHRLMHHKKLFNLFHLVHHQSTNPSPWAAYAFHPLEAIVEIGIYPIFLFTIPIHYLHFIIFFLFSIIYNVYGHLGYELYPKGFNKTVVGKWINTSVSHNQHHQYFKGNYGLYFTFWDRMMHTLRSDYDERFETVTSKQQSIQPVL
ncbi:MAG: sterol desaturase family protein [Bacteroidetes bacterium]|nr:sterol desaturase family protein [Bacteroidota bacterium]